MPLKTWGIAMLVFLTPLECQPSDIRQRSYSYSFEAAASRTDGQFVICTDCPDSKITESPLAPKLAVRLSEPLKVVMPAPLESKAGHAGKSDVTEPSSLIGTVHFDFDRASLTRGERQKLDGLLKTLPKGSSFDLTGYTCSVGLSDYNEALSRRRAAHVERVFRENGLSVGTVMGKGECCPVSEEKRLNRRVEIWEQRKERM